jgi:hypothetical protein
MEKLTIFDRALFQNAYNNLSASCYLIGEGNVAKRLTLLLLAVLLPSLVCIVVAPAGKGEATTTKLYVDPADIENASLVPNTTFNVSIKVDDIPASPGVVGIQFTLSWNSSLLNGVSMQEVVFHETMPPSEITTNLWMLANTVLANNATYAYTYLSTKTAISKGYAPLNGSYTIAIITLKVVGVGSCALQFISPKLGGPSGAAIPIQVVNGFFSNLAVPPAPKAALLYVVPARIANSSLTSGQNFTVDVDIANASGVSGLEFELGFNASQLHANSVAGGSLIPGSVTPITQIDNTAAFAKFNVSLPTPLSGNGTLATMQFQVEADKVRNSTLHLFGVKLVDNTGQSLPFNTTDGGFTNAPVLVGDLNGDGVVDVYDAITLAKSFMTSPGDPDWNPDADLNGDGIINIVDVIILGENFGKTA